jgi:DNA topoisomerase-1
VKASTEDVDAEAAGLRWCSDEQPGITRRRSGSGFTYRTTRGAPLRDKRQLARIRALVIPPAWQDVWISPDARGHLQATGRDVRGRKQYLYHPAWRTVRDGTKFDRMLQFGSSLPALREQIERDLARPGLPRERVLAAVVRLVDETLIRVGNEQYRRANGSFGATTMRKRHAEVDGRRIAVEFKGKGGKLHQSELTDARLARVLRDLHDLPGRELFEFVDDEAGERHRIHSHDVNDYLREVGGEGSTVKDFRTWGASALCLRELAALAAPTSEAAAGRAIAGVVREVASALGNTPAVCRASYLHPALLESYAAGELGPVAARRLHGLDRWESGLMRFLRARS